jgi:hypothetical protein
MISATTRLAISNVTGKHAGRSHVAFTDAIGGISDIARMGEIGRSRPTATMDRAICRDAQGR